MTKLSEHPLFLLTIKQASEMLNVHPNTLRNWEKFGKIRAIRIGTRRDRRYVASEVMQIAKGDTLA